MILETGRLILREMEEGDYPALYRVYRLIYLFHIPLFAFVSGLFLKDSAGCLRQLGRMWPLLCPGICT